MGQVEWVQSGREKKQGGVTGTTATGLVCYSASEGRGNKNTEGLKEGYRRVKETKGRDRLNQTALKRRQSGETGRRGDRYGEEGEKT